MSFTTMGIDKQENGYVVRKKLEYVYALMYVILRTSRSLLQTFLPSRIRYTHSLVDRDM